MAMASLASNLSFLASSLKLVDSVGSRSSMHNGVQTVAMTAGKRQRSRAGGPMKVVMMAKREQELVDIRKMSQEEINETVIDLKGELFLLRTKKATRQEYKSSEFRRMRKQIARMLTVRREREIEQGITMRESRKLDRKWKKSIVPRPPPSYAATLAEQAKK
jgi:large subunit ribosomal protein L29